MRKQLLAEKLTANRQRWLARLFVARLPAPLQEVLGNAGVVVVPESTAIARHQYADKRGAGVESPRQPPYFYFAAFRERQQVFDALKALDDRVDSEIGYFQPKGFFPVEALPRGPGEPPLFEVNFGWARRHLIDLYEPAAQTCALTTRNGEAGIYTQVVCGYQDRPADEEVFELSSWGLGGTLAFLLKLIPNALRAEWGDEFAQLECWKKAGILSQALDYPGLFWPPFVECDDCIFLAARSPGSLFDLGFDTKKSNLQAIESEVNKMHIVYLFSCEPTRDQVIWLGRLLKKMWSWKLRHELPHRPTIVSFDEGAKDKFLSYIITFFQVTARPMTPKEKRRFRKWKNR